MSWRGFGGCRVQLLTLCGVLFAGHGLATTTTNLLTNPGAEDGNLTGWISAGPSQAFVDNGSFDAGINPNTGVFDFAGGAGSSSGASGTLTQVVTLVGVQGISAALIDSGVLLANLQFFEQGLNQGVPSDDALVSLLFLDGSNATISSVSSGAIDSHGGTWQNFSNTDAIPVGTRSIAYQMMFIRNRGTDLDAFIDDNSLTVSGVVPEPATVFLMALALGGFAALRYRRRRQGATS
jgi:PEP-CTERM motif